eukprot:TRINITY_DN1051_c0_g1_i3.p1 TRINITY_DN1051_c0_g1~~TRINITY_DN1051_c0_g1_i3.p1  ORF type:complete len:391 (-),score=161.88 TRINITY_DN1051_c0_g1_i3:175-1347(-)
MLRSLVGSEMCIRDRRSIWALSMLSRHSHPAVAKISVLLLLGQEVVFDSHPLDDLTLPNFLQMFVDAKATPTEDLTTVTGGSKGVAVFKRTMHVPVIPSASDAHFVEATPETVDVTALFLHRYAVQRQQFLHSQTSKKFNPWDSKKKSSGDNLLEGDNDDDDILAFSESDDEEERKAIRAEKKAKKDEQKRQRKEEAAAAAAADETPEELEARLKGAHNEALFGPEKVLKKKKGAVEAVVADEISASEDEDVSDDGFDADFADDDSLDWGSDDEHAFDDDLEGEDDSLEDNDGEDEDEDNGMLGAGAGDGDDTGDDFGALVERNKKAPTKRARQQSQWEAKQMSNAREFESTQGGRRVESSGGRGFSSRGGRGGAPSRGGRGGAPRGGRW